MADRTITLSLDVYTELQSVIERYGAWVVTAFVAEKYPAIVLEVAKQRSSPSAKPDKPPTVPARRRNSSRRPKMAQLRARMAAQGIPWRKADRAAQASSTAPGVESSTGLNATHV